MKARSKLFNDRVRTHVLFVNYCCGSTLYYIVIDYFWSRCYTTGVKVDQSSHDAYNKSTENINQTCTLVNRSIFFIKLKTNPNNPL